MQTLTKNKQEVKYLRQTDGSLKLQLPLITLKPLKSDTFFFFLLAEVWLKQKVDRVSEYISRTVPEFLVSILTLISCWLLETSHTLQEQSAG